MKLLDNKPDPSKQEKKLVLSFKVEVVDDKAMLETIAMDPIPLPKCDLWTTVQCWRLLQCPSPKMLLCHLNM